MDETDALEALSNILNRLTEDPYDISLHVEHVRIAQQTGMEDQLDSALEMVTAFWAAGDYVWLPLIERKIQASNLESPEDLQGILDLFGRAEQDYLSMPSLRKHFDFLVERYEHFTSSEMKPDDLGVLFSVSWMHAAMSEVASKGIGHLTESHTLWDAYRDWELEQLQNASPDERAASIHQVDSMLLERLQQPHSNHDETFQSYSSFTTNFKPPDEYELLMVEASRCVRRPPFVLQTLYERAIAEADKRRWNGEANAETVLRSFWIGYLDSLRIQEAEKDVQAATFQRALKSVPASGEVWARYIRFLQRFMLADNEETGVAATYEKTKAIRPLQADAEQLVPVVLARASYENELMGDWWTTGKDNFGTLEEVILDGIKRIRQASPAGDPRVRVEKFFAGVLSRLEDKSERIDELWDDATKHYKTSYIAWTHYTEALIQAKEDFAARHVFKDICMKNLDWPEAIWDAWIAFEQVHGSVKSLEEAMDKLSERPLCPEAEKAEYAAMQLIAEQQANMVSVADAPVPPVTGGESGAAPMDVDPGPSASAGTKRKAEEEVTSEDANKKAKTVTTHCCLSDRENCTVFVADLPAGAKEDDLRALFKDCGPMREIKMTQLPNSLVATVEFMERDSVPAALTKDKKRIDGQEVAVHLAWQSTLYVTNFPEKADDKFIRNLFAKYGTIFDVRWPSKKFKSTRRFCYVQFTSPLSAQTALELHNQELENGLTLNVYISNPERRKDRSDADANDREIYVAGLSKFANKEDLENVFKTYGAVKEVRMALDNTGRPKGFAFVEFENEQDAMAALSANNHELKNRRMAVTLADTRVRARAKDPNVRAEIRNRTVRVRNLPANTQEGLLQQALEKLAPVKRVEVFADKAEAEVQFESAADVGKLFLRTEPVVFNGNTLELVDDTPGGTRAARHPASTAPPPTAGPSMFIPRTAASRPRAGLGNKKRATAISAAARTSDTTAGANPKGSASAQGKGQDDFRKMLG
ncbi:RNA-binding protein Prp24 [Fomitopsis serialis]|uniref:RNA-binding protein Prp24 n=1 Tax=Fomitopsis serialis TaxID=139415 RepID=UPI002008069F|nr:RNA-binding protein Prp24 [Neoantrodia serialis]KAH9925562.1 RNA-binding protein Prp24 [Neoantrodia serialis]